MATLQKGARLCPVEGAAQDVIFSGPSRTSFLPPKHAVRVRVLSSSEHRNEPYQRQRIAVRWHVRYRKSWSSRIFARQACCSV